MSFDAARRGGGFSTGRAGEGVRRAASQRAGSRALGDLRAQLGDGPFALVLLFVSPDQDREALSRALPGAFGDALVVGCTTAGEIGPDGYASGGVTALALPQRDFAVAAEVVEGVGGLRLSDAAQLARRLTGRLEDALASGARPRGRRFGVMLSDGAAAAEDALAFAFGETLGPSPFLGGSSGNPDGRTGGFLIAADGRFVPDAAASLLVETRCGLRPLVLDAVLPTETRMVVTAVDPDSRRVTELNGEPAAAEYARLAGLSPDALGAAAFAAHPLAAAAAGRLHPRALLAADDDGGLRFAAAVEEGMVLRLASPPDVAAEVEAALADLAQPDPPEALIVFESVQRRREAEASQAAPRASAALARAGALGFSTWGEQAGRLHGSGGLSALALYAPAPDAPPPFAGGAR